MCICHWILIHKGKCKISLMNVKKLTQKEVLVTQTLETWNKYWSPRKLLIAQIYNNSSARNEKVNI